MPGLLISGNCLWSSPGPPQEGCSPALARAVRSPRLGRQLHYGSVGEAGRGYGEARRNKSLFPPACTPFPLTQRSTCVRFFLCAQAPHALLLHQVAWRWEATVSRVGEGMSLLVAIRAATEKHLCHSTMATGTHFSPQETLLLLVGRSFSFAH